MRGLGGALDAAVQRGSVRPGGCPPVGAASDRKRACGRSANDAGDGLGEEAASALADGSMKFHLHGTGLQGGRSGAVSSQ
jgi:hypothetical protein